MTYHYLLDLALILLSTKGLGLLTKRFQLPQVVGALLAGLILGPSMLDVLTETDFIAQLAELGVIVLMFNAGVGTDIQELKKTGKVGFMVALIGVLVPLAMGTGITLLGVRWGLIPYGGMLEALFVGTILTATSVSITVETLNELGKLNTKVGNTILAAALIDDVMGLVALTLVSSIAGEKDSVGLILLKVALFAVFVGITGFAALRFFSWLYQITNGKDLRRFPVLAFVLCLLMAYCAERFFGVADITGAYAAGLIISCTKKAKYIQSKFEPVSYLLLTPVFFASIGFRASLDQVDGQVLLFTFLLLVVAILSKLIGCGFGARICGFSNRESLRVGVGMACRGEVALIVANRGLAMGVISNTLMTPVIITVVLVTILTPIMLKLAYPEKGELQPSTLTDRYGETEQLDILSADFLDQNRERKETKESLAAGKKSE